MRKLCERDQEWRNERRPPNLGNEKGFRSPGRPPGVPGAPIRWGPGRRGWPLPPQVRKPNTLKPDESRGPIFTWESVSTPENQKLAASWRRNEPPLVATDLYRHLHRQEISIILFKSII